MTFDKKLKEGARAADAVDRLRDLKGRLKEEQDRKDHLADWAIRLVLIAILAAIIGYAVMTL